MRKLVLFVLVAAVAVGAVAQQGGGMQPVIAPDGTVLVSRPGVAADDRMTSELVAVSPAGVTLWTWDAAAMMHAVAVRDARVFVVARDGAGPSSMPMHRANAKNEEVVSLALATGAVQWRREVAGVVTGLESTADRVYVVSRASGTGPRGGMMTGRGMHAGFGASTLTALDAATGSVLWTVELR